MREAVLVCDNQTETGCPWFLAWLSRIEALAPLESR
jgi:hypothetical protein